MVGGGQRQKHVSLCLASLQAASENYPRNTVSLSATMIENPALFPLQWINTLGQKNSSDHLVDLSHWNEEVLVGKWSKFLRRLFEWERLILSKDPGDRYLGFVGCTVSFPTPSSVTMYRRSRGTLYKQTSMVVGSGRVTADTCSLQTVEWEEVPVSMCVHIHTQTAPVSCCG